MSDLRTAAQQALEALEDARTFTGAWPTGSKAITNLRAALAAQGCYITQDITRQEYERLYPDAEEEVK